MRISLTDSRAAGFKKWSDAQRPSDRPPAESTPQAPPPAGEATRVGGSAGKAGK
jgi:hypothetical protein